MRLGFKKITMADTGYSNPIMLNYRGADGASYGLSVDASSGAATVEFTLSDLQNGDTGIWHQVTALGTVTSATKAALLSSPASAVRLNVSNAPVVLRIRESK